MPAPEPNCGDGICGVDETVALCPFDCAINQCEVVEQTVKTWSGQVILTPDQYNSNWYGCFGISLKNTGTLTAISFIMTIKVCPTTASINDLTGYQLALIANSNGNFKYYQSISNDIMYLPSQTYSAGRICFDFPTGAGFLPTSIRFGVELRDQKTGCIAGECHPTCGDGTCGSGESADNCPVDCASAYC